LILALPIRIWNFGSGIYVGTDNFKVAQETSPINRRKAPGLPRKANILLLGRMSDAIQISKDWAFKCADVAIILTH